MNNQSIESFTKITNDLFAFLDIIEQPLLYNYVNSLFVPFEQFCIKAQNDLKFLKMEEEIKIINNNGNEIKIENEDGKEIKIENKYDNKRIKLYDDNYYEKLELDNPSNIKEDKPDNNKDDDLEDYENQQHFRGDNYYAIDDYDFTNERKRNENEPSIIHTTFGYEYGRRNKI